MKAPICVLTAFEERLRQEGQETDEFEATRGCLAGLKSYPISDSNIKSLFNRKKPSNDANYLCVYCKGAGDAEVLEKC